MKKLAPLALAMAMIPSAVSATARPVEVYVNGIDVSEQKNPRRPVIREDRTYLPLRGVLEDMGLTVDWNGKDRSVVVRDGEKKITMTIGKKSYDRGGETVEMDVAPFIEGDRTYVPIRFMAEGIGMKVDWDEKNRMAIVGTYLDGDDEEGAEVVQREDYRYSLDEKTKESLVVEVVDGNETFYDEMNREKGGEGRVGEIRRCDDPAALPVPTIVLDKIGDEYLVFTFASDVQVADIDDDALIKSYQNSRAAVKNLLKTLRIETEK